MNNDTNPATTKRAKEQLRAFVERIERLEEEKSAVADDIKSVYAEATASGFDAKALRAIIRLRKQDAAERAEFAAILDTYMHALGMLVDTPPGRAAAAAHMKSVAEKSVRKGEAAEMVHLGPVRDEEARQ